MKATAKLFVLLMLIGSSARPAVAQAIFSAAGDNSTVVATGHAELLGEFVVSVESGTTAAGTLEVEISPVRLSNDDTSGITIDGTAGLAGASILAVFQNQGLILIDIPGGAVAGASITISGMRVSASDPALSGLEATISVSNNLLGAGQTEIPLLDEVEDGLLVDDDADVSFTILNRLLIDDLDGAVFREGFETAFTGAVGTLGACRE